MPGAWDFKAHVTRHFSPIHKRNGSGGSDTVDFDEIYEKYKTINWGEDANLYGFESIEVKKVDTFDHKTAEKGTSMTNRAQD